MDTSSVDLSKMGLGTGIDWPQIIKQEMDSYRETNLKPLQEREKEVEATISTLGELESKLGSLSSVADKMDTASELKAMTAKSSNTDQLTVSAGPEATEGSHDVMINQLANSEIETHSGVDELETVVNNTGSTQQFAYTYNGSTYTVDVNDGATLADLRDTINNAGDNPGVSASVLDDGSGTSTSHHLVLKGSDTGSDYGISIDDATTNLDGDWSGLSADANGTSSVTVNDATPFSQYQAVKVNDDDSTAEYKIIDSISSNTLTLQSSLSSDFTTGQNAYTTPRGIGSGAASSISAGVSEITVSDADDFQVGKQIMVADGSGNETLTISSIDTSTETITVEGSTANSYTTDAYVTQLEGGRKFNFDSGSFTETQSAQNAQVRVDGYPSSGWIERQSNTFNDVIPDVTMNLQDATGGDTVTVTVNRDTEAVKKRVQGFVEKYNAVRQFINEKTEYNTETEEAGKLMGNYVARFIESDLRNLVTSPAPGFDSSSDTYSLMAELGIETVGNADDDAKLGTLEIDETELDNALSDNYDAAIDVLSDHFSGASDSDNLEYYQSSEELTEPGKYDVKVDFNSDGSVNWAEMKRTSEDTYRSADISSDGNYVIGQSGNPEDNLWVSAQYDGSGADTQHAVVRVKQGVVDAMNDSIDHMLDSMDGILPQQQDSYENMEDNLEDQIADEKDAVQQLEDRLINKYARLEESLSQMQSQLDSTKNMAGSLFSQQA